MQLTLPEEGRPTPAPDLSAEQLAQIRTARARLRSADHGPRRNPPWERGRRAFLLQYMLPLVLTMLILWWIGEFFGFWWFIALLALLMLLLTLFGRVLERHRAKAEAQTPEKILAGYEGRYILLKELDSPSRELLLRAQQAVDASPHPAGLAAQEWELALMLREHTRAWAGAAPGDPDHWEQDIVALLHRRQRAEALLRDLEQRAQ